MTVEQCNDAALLRFLTARGQYYTTEVWMKNARILNEFNRAVLLPFCLPFLFRTNQSN